MRNRQENETIERVDAKGDALKLPWSSALNAAFAPTAPAAGRH
jgi:3-methyladenine DNA glycosylase AlkC